MWSEVFWMSIDRKDDSETWRTDQTYDFPLLSPHIQASGSVDPPSNTFNISSFYDGVQICSTHTYNDWKIKSTHSVLRVHDIRVLLEKVFALYTNTHGDTQ